MMRSVMLLVLAVTASSSHAATLYKSVAPDGTISYTDQPPASGKVAKTFDFANLPATPLPPSSVTAREPSAAKANVAGSEPKLFWAKWCPYCRQAEAYLTTNGIAFQKLDVDTAEGKQALAQLGGGKGIPVIVSKGQTVRGYSRQAYDALFAKAR